MKTTIRRALDAKKAQIVGSTQSYSRLLKSEDAACREALIACKSFCRADAMVYLAQTGSFVRIGYTMGTVEARVEALAIGTPHDVHILAKIPGAYKLERALHRIFAEHHHRGEWFRLEGSLRRFTELIQGFCFPRRDAPRGRHSQAEVERLSPLRQLR